MPTKAFRFKLKQLEGDDDDVEGTFTGIASVYDQEDLGGDTVDPGAFDKTLQTGGPTRPLLWAHSDPIGLVTLTDTKSALAVSGKLSMGLQQARDAYQLLKDQVVTGLSIGYQVVKQDFIDGVRHLTEVKLWEISLTPFPMLPSAQVASVKAIQLAAQQAGQVAIRKALRSFRIDVIKALER
jgi:hypothetical protein